MAMDEGLVACGQRGSDHVDCGEHTARRWQWCADGCGHEVDGGLGGAGTALGGPWEGGVAEKT